MAHSVISEGDSTIESGSAVAGIFLVTSEVGEISSDQRKCCLSATSRVSGKCSCATVSLYPKSEIEGGKNSPHSRV